MEESGAIKPVLQPCVWCSFALSMLMYGTPTGSCSGRSWPYDNLLFAVKRVRSIHPAQYAPVSSGRMVIRYQRYCRAHAPIGWGVASCRSVEECASKCHAVLAGRRSCDWYDQQGELGSNHYRVIARLIYLTRCSKCHSGVLIFQFRSLR